MSECKQGHNFININDLPKIDNIKCSKCGMTYYQLLLCEVGFWKQDNADLRAKLEAHKAANKLLEADLLDARQEKNRAIRNSKDIQRIISSEIAKLEALEKKADAWEQQYSRIHGKYVDALQVSQVLEQERDEVRGQVAMLRGVLESCKRDLEHAKRHGTLRAFGMLCDIDKALTTTADNRCEEGTGLYGDIACR